MHRNSDNNNVTTEIEKLQNRQTNILAHLKHRTENQPSTLNHNNEMISFNITVAAACVFNTRRASHSL